MKFSLLLIYIVSELFSVGRASGVPYFTSRSIDVQNLTEITLSKCRSAIPETAILSVVAGLHENPKIDIVYFDWSAKRKIVFLEKGQDKNYLKRLRRVCDEVDRKNIDGKAYVFDRTQSVAEFSLRSHFTVSNDGLTYKECVFSAHFETIDDAIFLADILSHDEKYGIPALISMLDGLRVDIVLARDCAEGIAVISSFADFVAKTHKYDFATEPVIMEANFDVLPVILR